MIGEISSHSHSSVSTSDSSLAVAVASSNNLVEFKTPNPPPLRKKKKKVLDEETYVHELGKIIERDFFPDLENLKDNVQYLEALENNDVEQLQTLYRKYSTASSRLSTPASVVDSPATFDTPEPKSGKRRKRMAAAAAEDLSPNRPLAADGASTAAGSPTATGADADDAKSTAGTEGSVSGKTTLSLDEFLARNTSEDDDSFEQIMEDTRQKYMHKKAWMFNAEKLHNAVHAPDLSMKALPANDHEARALLKREQQKPQAIENWTYKTFNSMMYVPDEQSKSRARELELAGLPQREVVHSNTRFSCNPFVKPLNQATVLEASAVQAFKKEGRIGVDGRELSKETPRVRGYTFVGEASPVPGGEESPLITWGEVEGTPFMLDRSNTPLIHSSSAAPSYSIPKVPYRDVICHQLNEKANQAQRDKKSKAVSAARNNLYSPLTAGGRGGSGGGGSERWSSERLSNMSPAARRLLSSGLGVRQNTDRTLRASYTPSSSARLNASSSARSTYLTPSPGARKGVSVSSSLAAVKTPKALRSPSVRAAGLQHTPGKAKSSASSSAAASSLTDGLLQLPKRDGSSTTSASKLSGRLCAEDFF